MPAQWLWLRLAMELCPALMCTPCRAMTNTSTSGLSTLSSLQCAVLSLPQMLQIERMQRRLSLVWHRCVRLGTCVWASSRVNIQQGFSMPAYRVATVLASRRQGVVQCLLGDDRESSYGWW